MSTKHVIRSSERGVTALFIVLFAALLLSIITVSFIAMMAREQQRSTDNELSQSAYDSALAGVEDGKRVMAACRDNPSGGTACSAIEHRQCTTIIDAGIQSGEANGEVFIQSSTAGDGRELDQAYTCVVINGDTPNYLAELAHDESVIIPLKGKGTFSKVTVSWHTSDDTTPSPIDGLQLPQLSAWSLGRPALIRAQLMQYSGNIPSDFDGAAAHTLYLHPQASTATTTFSVGLDGRRAGALEPQGVSCTSGTFPLSGYACQATLQLLSGTSTGYLRLTSLYVGTHLQVELRDSSDAIVDFDDVQPMIDSTGRANDLFRRVEARIETTNPNFLYPRATVDITNNFCKTFSVSDTAGGYQAGGCNPEQAGP